MMGNRFLVLSLLAVCLLAPRRSWSAGDTRDTTKTPASEQVALPGMGGKLFEDKNYKEQAQRQKNADDFRQLKLVDSVGWFKVTAVKRPDESMDQLQKERAQRMASALKEYCVDSRFQRQAEVDFLQQMTAEERAFCKDRLNLSNPLIP